MEARSSRTSPGSMFVPLEPFRDTSGEITALTAQLEASTKLKAGRARKTVNVLTNNDRKIDSWKFNEWDYGKEHKGIVLPCNARGLFIIDNAIAVRGYDKFFNVDEVPATKTAFLEENTRGPYDVTLKENGCIIFVSGLKDGTLVVCSKHSTGLREDLENQSRNHALQGEIQIKKQLAKIGKTPQQLAKILYDLNITAVAEYCDDEFEEHVLEYSRDSSGLYLHGLNLNTIKFRTYPTASVEAFAQEWGFREVKALQKDNFHALMEFLDDCAKTGTYDGKEIEGFVVRSTLKDLKSDFFFKYKFEEPYLLYRQLREVTKRYIFTGSIFQVIGGVKKHKLITFKYLQFVEKLFADHPDIKDAYSQGFGVIKVRKMFLELNGLTGSTGMKVFSMEDDNESMELTKKLELLSLQNKETKYVLVPISTIGCGKTTTFKTLTNLFPSWGHIQNDDIPSGKKDQIFTLTLAQLAKPECKLVFFDRNNHQFRERSQIFQKFDLLRNDYLDSNIELKFVAVNFVSASISDDDWWNITYDRIVERGDNHQSIKSSSDRGLAILVMKGFIGRFQALQPARNPDSRFDKVIDLGLNKDSSLENAKTVLKTLKDAFPDIFTGLEFPSDAQFEESFKTALGYQPSFTKTFGSKGKEKKKEKKEKKPYYFGIKIDNALEGKISSLVSNSTWDAIKKNERVQKEFHITLHHKTTTKGNPEMQKSWDALSKLFELNLKKRKDGNGEEGKQTAGIEEERRDVGIFCDIRLITVVVVKDHLVAVEAEIVKTYNSTKEMDKLQSTNEFPHITIGTSTPEIKAFQSNQCLALLHEQVDEKVLKNGVYQVGDFSMEVIHFEDEVMEKQPCFINY